MKFFSIIFHIKREHFFKNFCIMFLGIMTFLSGYFFEPGVAWASRQFHLQRAVSCFGSSSQKTVYAKDVSKIRKELETTVEVISNTEMSEAEQQILTLKLRFYLFRKSEKNYVHLKRKVREGDYFLFQVPDGFFLEPHFSSGMIKKGDYIIATYHKLSNEYQEFIKFTLTDCVRPENRLYDISGSLTLHLRKGK